MYYIFFPQYRPKVITLINYRQRQKFSSLKLTKKPPLVNRNHSLRSLTSNENYVQLQKYNCYMKMVIFLPTF